MLQFFRSIAIDGPPIGFEPPADAPPWFFSGEKSKRNFVLLELNTNVRIPDIPQPIASLIDSQFFLLI